MPSQDEEIRINKKIEELKKELARLEKEYKDMVDFNNAAWNMYGSELCAGDMAGKEKKILDMVHDVNTKIILLQNLISGRINIDDEEENIRRKMAEIDQQEQQLKACKKIMQKSAERIDFLKSVLKG